MFGLEHLVCVLPPAQLVQDIAAAEDARAAARANGIMSVPIAPPGGSLELARAATEEILRARPDLAGRVAGALFAHSLPAPLPPGRDLLGEWLDPIGLGEIEALVVSGQPCAILHQALRLAGQWLSELPADAVVLIVGADAANAPSERLFFGSAMGDSAVACLATRATERHRVCAVWVDTDVVAPLGEFSDGGDIARFRLKNPSAIRKALEGALAEAGLQLSDLRLICPHTPNVALWDAVAELLRVPRTTILTDYISETGHLNSNDSLVHLQRALAEGRVSEGDHIALVNAGFGGTRGCTILRV